MWRSVVKRCMVWMAIGLAMSLLLWIPLAWFFFGSAHPCGVLAERRMDREMAYADIQVRRQMEYVYLFGIASEYGAETSKDIPRIRPLARQENIQSAYVHTPAQCLWRSIIWRWDKESDQHYQQEKRDVDKMRKER